MSSAIEHDFWELMSDNITIDDLQERRKVREDLAKQHTRKLLDMRIGWSWYYKLPHDQVLALLYEELGRRGHIPNKHEAISMRKAKIKQGTSNRGSKREHKKQPRPKYGH